jgi:serine/threonine protein kinase
VTSSAGGFCRKCGRRVSPDKLQLNSALAVTINQVTSMQQQAVQSCPEVSPAAQWIGRRLGHFEIVEPLGQGGMGQVYRALDHALQRYVAVKVLRRGKSDDADQQIELLLQEAIAQARVNHPNVATIYHVSRDQGDPFLAMELVDGGTLADRIRGGPLAFGEIASIATQIVDALRSSLQFDIIHGDIKPNNLLIKHSGEVKLSDFGMARSASKEEDDSGFGGTPNYLAPELLHGEPPSIQSDMYALGVTLYEMTFGRLPVHLSGSTFREWIVSHESSSLDFPTPWPEHLPLGWRTLLSRLLAKSPADRFQNYDEVQALLRTLVPRRSPPARLLPRLVAAAIDYMIIFLFWIPITVFAELRPTRWILPTSFDWLGGMLASVLSLAPLAAYSFFVSSWKQSIGRNLMQLRVVNRFGLTPSTRLMLTRTTLRMLPLWMLALLPAVGRLGFLAFALSVGFWLGGLAWLAIDLAALVVLGKGKSLHDRLAGTRVVWDTK